MFNTTLTRTLLAALLVLPSTAAWAGAGQLDRALHRRLHALAEVYGQGRLGPEQTERFSRTFKVGKTGALELANISGDIVVTAGPGEDIVIEATKRARGRDEAEAKKQLADVTIEAVLRAGRVEVRTQYPQHSNRVAVDYRVTVPAGGAVDVKSVSGDIKVTGAKGEVHVESVSGDVTADGLGSIARIKSVSGDAEVSGVSGDGEVTVGSVSGDVTARGIKCRSLEANSVSGEVRLTDVSCERARVGTISGNVEYSGSLARGGHYELKAHSGNVRLALGTDTGFELEASTFSGNVRSDLPVNMRATGTGTREGRRPQQHTLSGTYGDGSAQLDVRSFSGDITIVKR